MLRVVFKFLVLFVYLPTNLGLNVHYCVNLNPTHDFDEEAVLGMWYIHEYIYHRDNETKTEYNPYCPIIQIRKFEDYVHGGLITRDLVSTPTYIKRQIILKIFPELGK